MKYKWIAQDHDGRIDMYTDKPQNDSHGWFTFNYKNIVKGSDIFPSNWKNSLINLETHDYKIENGILMKVEKEQIIKGSELQFEGDDGVWQDCSSLMRCRIKPKIVRFRNYLDCTGNISATQDAKRCNSTYFVKWLGDWQEVEVPNE